MDETAHTGFRDRRRAFAVLAAAATVVWAANVIVSKHHHALTYWLVVPLALVALTCCSAWLDCRTRARRYENNADTLLALRRCLDSGRNLVTEIIRSGNQTTDHDQHEVVALVDAWLPRTRREVERVAPEPLPLYLDDTHANQTGRWQTAGWAAEQARRIEVRLKRLEQIITERGGGPF